MSVEAVLDPLMLLEAVRDVDGQVVDFVCADANRAACEFLATTSEELVGDLLMDRVPACDAAEFLAACRGVAETGEPLRRDSVSYALGRCAQDDRRFDVRAVRVGDGLSYTWRDVTAYDNAAADLAASREHYRLLAEHSSDVVIVTGLDRRVTWVAPTVKRALGWTADDLLGAQLADLAHPDDTAALADLCSRLRRPEAASAGEVLARMRARSGEYRWMSGRATLLAGEDGRPIGVVTAMQDVEELMRAQEAVRRDQSRLRATLDSLLDPHMLAEAVRGESGEIIDFVCADANEAAGSYLGIDRPLLVGARVRDVLSSEAASILVALWREAVESGRPVLLDDHAAHPDILVAGRRYDIRMVRVGDGLSCTWRDVTERHETERSLRRSVRELRALDRIFRLLAERTGLGSALDAACDEVCEHFEAPAARIHLMDEDADELTPDGLEVFGASGDASAADEMSLAAQALASGGPAASPGGGRDGVRTLAVPMVTRSRAVGVLTITRDADAVALDDRDLALARSVADTLAGAVENERLHERQTRQAATAERHRLARDLHDSVTQTIYSANLIAEVLPGIWARAPQEGEKNTETLRRLIRAALSEMRTLLFELRPETLAAAPLDTLLERLGEALAGQGVAVVDVAVARGLDLPIEVKLAFYRVAQEALTNVAKHARAAEVAVALTHDGDVVRLEVRDDGRGFAGETTRPQNMGLRIMEERAEEIDAVLAIESAVGAGTAIKLAWRYPLAQAENH